MCVGTWLGTDTFSSVFERLLRMYIFSECGRAFQRLGAEFERSPKPVCFHATDSVMCIILRLKLHAHVELVKVVHFSNVDSLSCSRVLDETTRAASMSKMVVLNHHSELILCVHEVQVQKPAFVCGQFGVCLICEWSATAGTYVYFTDTMISMPRGSHMQLISPPMPATSASGTCFHFYFINYGNAFASLTVNLKQVWLCLQSAVSAGALFLCMQLCKAACTCPTYCQVGFFRLANCISAYLPARKRESINAVSHLTHALWLLFKHPLGVWGAFVDCAMQLTSQKANYL